MHAKTLILLVNGVKLLKVRVKLIACCRADGARKKRNPTSHDTCVLYIGVRYELLQLVRRTTLLSLKWLFSSTMSGALFRGRQRSVRG